MAGDKDTQDTATILDSTNPLYIHPSESVGTVLVPVAFDGTGYRSWRRGKCKKPNAGEVTYDQWALCDDMVTSWILNSLSKDLVDGLQYVSDAKELWQELEDRSNLYCDYCKKQGRAKEKCYRLHGFPQDFKFTKGRNTRSAVNVHGQYEEMQVCSNEDADSRNHNQNLQNLIKEQYNQLLNLLENFKVNNAEKNSNMITSGAVNFADSGATNYMTYRKSFLTNIITLPYPFLATLPNGYKAPLMKRPLKIGKARSGLYFLCSKCHNYSNLSPSTASISSLSHSCVSISDNNASKKKDQTHPSHLLPTVNDPSCPLNNFDTSVKTIRSDNGLEFVNNETMIYIQEKGIVHQKTCPYTPQQNGVVENKYKHLFETARAPLYQSKLPIKYWGECILTATYIINRLPSTVLNNKSPFELLYNKKPKYSQLKSFGCLCYPCTQKTYRDKFELRATPHVFVGYPFGTKGYKVLDLATKKIHISRDVVFHENIFSFVVSPEHSNFPSVLHLMNSNPYCFHPNSGESNDYSMYDEDASIFVTDKPVTDNVAPVLPPSSPFPPSSLTTPNQMSSSHMSPENNPGSQPSTQA
nr:uncharacterized protein LOC104094096 [Nicotiana tomentosiformis]